MVPADVDNAIAWQNRTGLRLNMVYNMGGVDEFGVPAGNDALLAKFATVKNQFRWINHTLQHPNLDCTTERTPATSSRRTRRSSTCVSGR